MKKGSELEELTKAFKEILKVSEEYSYIFNDRDTSVNIAWGWIAQDENFSINVKKYGDKFLIGGKNFEDRPYQKGGGLNAKQAALRIQDYFEEYNISAESLKKGFYSSLKKPLGEYLANKLLEGKSKK